MNYEEVQKLKQSLKHDGVKYYRLTIKAPDVCDPSAVYLYFSQNGIRAIYKETNIEIDHHEMLQLASITGTPLKDRRSA